MLRITKKLYTYTNTAVTRLLRYKYYIKLKKEFIY